MPKQATGWATSSGSPASTASHPAQLAASDGLVHFIAYGPSFAAWLLPGVDAHARESPRRVRA
ncbi:hypothetical protein ACFWN7_15495 [Agromyces sp. NPDC058484]|uniref:hypothetical protein n=1 Tax=Agromyces sp. NPDC058484 TaxID=3346524 RepID=UPI003654AC1D